MPLSFDKPFRNMSFCHVMLLLGIIFMVRLLVDGQGLYNLWVSANPIEFMDKLNFLVDSTGLHFENCDIFFFEIFECGRFSAYVIGF